MRKGRIALYGEALIAAALLGSAPAQGAWKELVGKPLPSISVESWITAGDARPSTEELEGKVVLVEFFTGGAARVKELKRLHHRYHSKGLRVVAISDEEAGTLRKMVDDLGIEYWLGSDPHDTTLKEFVIHGLPFRKPHHYLVDVRGKVVANKFPTNTQIEKLLEDCFDPRIGRKLHDSLATVRSEYDRGAYATAWRAAAPHTKSKDKAVAADARFLRERVESYGAFCKRMAATDVEGMTEEQAYGKMLELRYDFEGLPTGEWAKEACSRLAKKKTIKSKKSLWKKLEDALKRDLHWNGKDYERQRALQLYRATIKRGGDSEAVRIAKQRLARLKSD